MRKLTKLLLCLFLAASALAQADPNCATSIFVGQCTTCKTGYFKNNNIGSQCLKCQDANCLSCDDFSAPQPGITCKQCSTGFYIDLATSTCKACPQGCSSCSPINPNRCLTCPSSQWYANIFPSNFPKVRYLGSGVQRLRSCERLWKMRRLGT